MLNLMLVDDEKNVIQGMTHILSKHCPEYAIVATAQSAEEALSSLQHVRADVVITDVIMPDMDGIALTKELRARYPRIAVVVLSGYADFEYVRQAMKNGADDYLLKPCNYRTILELLRKIEADRSVKAKASQTDEDKKLLAELIAGQSRLPESWKSETGLQLALIRSQGCFKSQGETRLQDHLAKWSGTGWSGGILYMDDHLVAFNRSVLDACSFKRAIDGFRQDMFRDGFRGSTVVTSVEPGNASLHQAYAVCLDMMSFLAFNEMAALMDDETYRRCMAAQEGICLRDFFNSEAIARYVVGADADKLRQYLEKNLNSLYRLGNTDPIRLKREAMKELVCLEQNLNEHGIDVESSPQGMDYMAELSRTETMGQLLRFLKSFTMSVLMRTNGDQQVPHYIRAAVQLIDSRYMEDLALKCVSDAVYLNPWYFSTQFKKYMKVSFSEYLNHVRIRMAKQLLKQQDLKVYQVAEMVGFKDAAYFSTVFKQLERMGPKEYQRFL